MKPSHIIIAVAVVFIGWKLLYHPKFSDEAGVSLTAFSDNSIGDAPCDGRNHCVYAYLAPWCPACKETIPILGQLRNFWQTNDRPGLIVIVGNGKPEALEAMAKQVGAPVFLDKDDIFMRTANVRHFPYFIVVDDQNKILAQGHSAQRWMEKEINQHIR